MFGATGIPLSGVVHVIGARDENLPQNCVAYPSAPHWVKWEPLTLLRASDLSSGVH